jgi:hypothetical protein
VSGGIVIRPITVSAARAWVRATHRHLPNLQGGLFAVAIHDDELCGVAVARSRTNLGLRFAPLALSTWV